MSHSKAQLPPIHRHPVSFCKVSSVHVACLVQSSQVHAGDLVISRSSGGGGSKTMPPYGDDQEYISLGYSGHETETVAGSNPSPSQSYVLRVFLEKGHADVLNRNIRRSPVRISDIIT